MPGCGAGSGDSRGTVGGTISLAWDANSQPDLAGYKLYWGRGSGVYDHSVDVGNITTYTLTDFNTGGTYFIAATIYDKSHNKSCYLNKVSRVAR
jgi:hypothetical protein